MPRSKGFESNRWGTVCAQLVSDRFDRLDQLLVFRCETLLQSLLGLLAATTIHHIVMQIGELASWKLIADSTRPMQRIDTR